MADEADSIENELFGETEDAGSAENTGDSGEGGEGGGGDNAGKEEGGNADDPKDGKEAGGESGDPKDGENGDPEGDKEGKEGDKPSVPLAALEKERGKRKAVEQRLARLEEQEASRANAEALASLPREGTPERAEYDERQRQFAAVNDRLNRSEYDARKEHGDEQVDAMMEWANAQFNTDKEFAKKVLSHAHPYDVAMVAYKEQQAKAATTADDGSKDPQYAAFLAWQASQNGGTPEAGKTADPNTDPAKAPKKDVPVSLGQRPSASGPAASGIAKDAFDAEFN